MPEEAMDVAPSEDNGNVPLDAPSEPTPETPEEGKDATPTPEPAPPAEPAAPVEPVLYETPDGRKVDAETLQKEWKENFLPEFTRKSQELAELKKAPAPINNSETEKNPFADPHYVPKSYEEIISEAEERALARIEQRERAQIETRQQVETQVANEIAEIKKTDPSLNTDLLFSHAVKYGFNSLTAAHKNMKDIAELVKTTQAQTVKNVTKRTDPVSKGSQPSGARPNPAQFTSARDYLNAVKGSSQDETLKEIYDI